MPISCIKTFTGIKEAIQLRKKLIDAAQKSPNASTIIAKHELSLKEWLLKLGKATELEKKETLSDKDILELYQQFMDISSLPLELWEFESWITGKEIEKMEDSKGNPPDSLENYTGENLVSTNFIDLVYGESSTRANMLRDFTSGIIKSIIVDLDNNREIMGDVYTLNVQLSKFKQDLYNKVRQYVEKETGMKFPPNLYELSDSTGIRKNIGLAKINEIIKTGSSDMKKLYTLSLDPRILSTWKQKSIGHDKSFKEKLDGYNAYFILSHFDSLLIDLFGQFILCKQTELDHIDSSISKYKYGETIDAETVKTWQQEDLFTKSAYDLIPKHLLRFIESLEILTKDSDNKEDLKGTGLYLTKNHLIYFIKQIKKYFREDKEELISITDIKTKSFEDIYKEVSERFPNISNEAKTDIVLKLQDTPVIDGVARISLGDLVNDIRDHNDLSLKTLFDVRRSLDRSNEKLFSSKIERRLFYNLYDYLFADNNSLYSSSRFLFGELASLFDVTSVVDHTEYKINDRGYVTVVELNPANKDRLKEIRKRNINSAFVPGEMLRYIKKYEAELINKNTVSEGSTNEERKVKFSIKGSDGEDYWRFEYRPTEDKWILSRRSATDKNNFEIYNPRASKNKKATARAKLTESDLRGLNDFIIDTLGIDFANRPELWDAFLDILNVNNEVMTPLLRDNLVRQAITRLLDICVRIYANALMFRATPPKRIIVDPNEPIQYDKRYKFTKRDVPYEDGVHDVEEYFYTTLQNTPYTKKKKIHGEETEVHDIDEVRRKFGRGDVKFRTAEDLLSLILTGEYEVEISEPNLFEELIESWYGSEKRDLVRPNPVYEGVDVISTKVDSEYLDPIVELDALTTGAAYKNQVDTAERTKITIGGSSMLFYEKFSRLALLGKDPTNPMAILNEFLNGGFVGNSFARDLDNRPDVKQCKDFNFKENFYACFVADFLLPMFMQGDKYGTTNVRFTDTVNSDKPNNPKLDIFRGEIRPFNEMVTLTKYALGDAYIACFRNIESDFKTLCDDYKSRYKTEIKLTMEDNFDSFNSWCQSHKISPLLLLARMATSYNNYHRHNPLAFYLGIHYSLDKSGNFYINRSFAESLIRYGSYTTSDYNARVNNLKDTITKIERNPEKFDLLLHLKHLQENLKKHIPDVAAWLKIINTIRSRYEETIIPSDKEEQEISSNINYSDFILYSNLDFLQSILKNDVVLDLKAVENDMLINDCLKKITAGMSKDDADEWKRRWTTFYHDRMAFGYLEIYNPKIKQFEELKDDIHTNRPKQIASRIDLHGLYNKLGNEIITNTDTRFRLTKKLYCKINGEEREVLIQINPLLKQYNINHHYWTSLSNLSITGSHVWSDAKKFTRTLDEESAKWFDSVKRNVINSATSTLFKIGSIWGVPTYANIAVIEDIRALCSGILGDTPAVKPYDGATFVNPFMYYLENYSLNQLITGYTKKPIYEFYNERLMAGGLIKTASFALNNDEVRNSFWKERALWKMTNRKWIDLNGNLLDVDLTLGLSAFAKEDPLDKGGLLVQVPGITENEVIDSEGLYYFELYNEEALNAKGELIYPSNRVINQIYSIRKITDNPKITSNYYEIKTKRINPLTGDYYRNKDGSVKIYKDYKVINSNYTFWKALGGYNSAKYNRETGEWEYSEDSIKTVALWMGKIRFDRRTQNLQQEVYKSSTEYQYSTKFTPKEKDILSHDNRLWYNPLKESDIHYIVTEGAIKKGAANINTVAEYSNDKQLNFYKIKLTQAGILLDPEHEADLSEVSLMTQVISGLADRGYTTALADEVYTALADLSNLAIQDSYKAFLLAYEQADRSEIQRIVTGLLVDEIQKSKTDLRSTNLARAIADRFISSAMLGEDLSFDNISRAFPFSDGSIFELLQSTVTSAINKKAIREKMFGSLSVLNPSYEFHKIYGNKRLSDILNFDEIRKIQETFNSRPLNSIAEVEIGRCYKIVQKDKDGNSYGYDGTIINLKDSDYYYLWKSRLAGLLYNLIETIYAYDSEEIKVKDIKTLREQIEQTNGQFNYYELIYNGSNGEERRIRRIGDVSDFAHLSNKNVLHSIRRIHLFGRELGSYNIHMNIVADPEPKHLNRYDLLSVLESAYRNIKRQIFKTAKELGYIKSDVKLYPSNKNFTDEQWAKILSKAKVNQDKVDLWKLAHKAKVKNLTKIEEEKALLNELNAIDSGRKLLFFDSDNQLVTARIANHSITHFEAILPMIYATQFGLRKGDSLGIISLDRNFFFKRMLENYISSKEPEASTYDICIKRSDGNHIYIKYAGDLKLLDNGFLAIKVRKYKDPQDKIFRLDPFSKNKRMHAMASMDDMIYQNPVTSKEIIVTKDIDFYLKNLDYTGIHFSKNIINEAEALQKVTDSLNGSKKTVSKYLGLYIKDKGILKYIEALDELISKINVYLKSPDKGKAAEELKALNNKIIGVMYDNAVQQHVSFLESLKFTVARIPAQGMQSFMAMDIVGFNNSGVNDCYVSAEQIRLQGSDYDVDKATFLGHAFNKAGHFIKWSKYFKMRTEDELKESKVLPFPTGLKGRIQKGNENSFDFSQYKSLFQKSEKTEKSNEETEVANDEKKEVSKTESIHYNLKWYRNQALLAKLINEVNKLGKEYFKKNPKESKFVITYKNKEDEEFVKAIMGVVNSHNTYLNDMSVESRSDALKNFIASRVFSISEHPANALVGETSVDVVSLPLKDLGDMSSVGHKPTESRPGNASTLWSALELNQTGKDVIGITASNGVKCYFGLSHVLNKAILDNKDLSPYKFDVPFIDRDTGEVKHYYFIANPNLNINTDFTPDKQFLDFKNRISNSKLSDKEIEWLYVRYKNLNEWAGSYISGILSLATDNAKELKLDQLNAGRDLAGLYLYGVQIGIPIMDIYKTMTSSTAQVVARIMKTNGFTYDDIAKNLSAAIKFLLTDRKNSVRISSGEVKSIIEKLNENGLTIEGLDTKNSFDALVSFDDVSSSDSIIKIIKDGNFETYMKRLRYIKDDLLDFRGYTGRKRREELGQDMWMSGYTWEQIDVKRSLDKFMHYAYDIYEIYLSLKGKSDIWGDLKNIETLNKGFSEIGQLRSLLGLNQGVKTKSADKLKFYEDFSQIISKRYDEKINEIHVRQKELEESGPDGKKSAEYKNLSKLENEIKSNIKQTLDNKKRIDFLKFFTDKEYLKNVVEIYDLIKHTVNPLRIVLELPHFNAYLNAAFLDYSNCSISSKFRAMTTEIMPHINEVFKPRDKNITASYVRRALSFIDGIITNRWLLERPAIILPKGAMKIGKDGSMTRSNEDFSVELGTQEGNATFQYWMNQEVIPRLKDGYVYGNNVSSGRRIITKGTDDIANTFLRDLIPNITNKTLDRNNMSIFALPIDMIPKSDIEADRLSKYKLDFNELNLYRYKISKDLDYNVVDLFFYYNLINFRNRGGELSLTPLLETLIQTNGSPILRDYIGFVSEFDREYDIKAGVDFMWPEFDKFIAPSNRDMRVASASASKIPYFWQLNQDTLKQELFRFNNQPEIEDNSYMGRLGYFKESTGLSQLHVYNLSFKTIEKLSDEPQEIEMSNAVVTVSLSGPKGNKQLKVHSARITALNGSDKDLKNIVIKGSDLEKLLKVSKDADGISYKINPVSLLIYLNAKRRIECGK